MNYPKAWGRISLDNEIVVLDRILRDGRNSWLAEGRLDGELMRVWLYGEHRRAISQAGYKIKWDLPQVAVIDEPTVALVEDGKGRRRVAAALKAGTTDEWIEVKQAVNNKR